MIIMIIMMIMIMMIMIMIPVCWARLSPASASGEPPAARGRLGSPARPFSDREHEGRGGREF